MRVRLAQEFGWSMEYIDDMNFEDYADVVGYLDGNSRADEAERD